MENTKLRNNFIYPQINPSHYRFGSGEIIGTILRPDGRWLDFLPPEELQRRNGIESSACYIEAQQHTIATIQEEQYDLKDQNYSARFNALLSEGSPYGGDPLAGAESIRKNDGLIPEELLSFSEEIKTWDEFHSFKGSKESDCRNIGKQFLLNWKLNYDIVFVREDTLKMKYIKLKNALKFSPVPISVYGQVDENGNYVSKPNGVNDTHLVEAIYVDNDNCIWIFDTYAPFIKKLPANYNSDFAMRWSVEKIKTLEIKKKLGLWQKLINIFFREKLIFRDFKKFWINLYNKQK